MSPRVFPSLDVASPPAKSARTAHLFLAGVGAVGSAVLEQLASANAPLRLIGACTSQRACWHPAGLPPRAVPDALADADPLDWSAVLQRLVQSAPRPLIFVDATGHPDVAGFYERLFQASIHVVTPSKLANTRPQADFDRLLRMARARGVHYRYETTVGAGLPVVQTVRDLVETGDRIRTIRGAVSGTLTFLFSALRNGSTFSAAVRAAIDRGYAEPDVRDDLSGEDVARKFIILARTAGHPIERSDVQVESLVPDTLHDVPREAVVNRLGAVDNQWRERSESAEDEEAVLQYLGTFSADGIRVGVQAVPRASAFGQLDGQDNLFEIATDRYTTSPLTVRGPGAGPDVTASGVLADVLKVARTITA